LMRISSEGSIPTTMRLTAFTSVLTYSLGAIVARLPSSSIFMEPRRNGSVPSSTMVHNSDATDFPIKSLKAEVLRRLKSASSPWPMASWSRIPGHPGPRTTAISPADITWDREKLVQPDLFVIPATEISPSWTTVRTLLLAVEVVSPSSARGDRLVKRRLYQRQRVATYWIVDLNARLVEVWRPDDERPEIVTDILRWRVAPDAADAAVDLATVFAGLPDQG